MKKYYIDVIADGVCLGNAVVLNFNNLDNFTQRSIAEEKNKLSIAIDMSIFELEKIQVDQNLDFIEVHKLLLQDKKLTDELYHEIEYNNQSAIGACNLVFDKYIDLFKNAGAVYMQDRYLDFLDIKQRVLKKLNNQELDYSNQHNIILVVDELIPSLLVDFNVKGVVCKKGGFTSHGAIVCRSLGIPCVVVKDYDIHTNDKIIIDSREKTVYVNPGKDLIKEYKTNISKLNDDTYVKFKHDGYKFLCNVSTNKEVLSCCEMDFDGIGLYRTEFIFMNSDHPLSVEEQSQIYLDAVNLMKQKPICFRTYDVSEDKKLPFIDNSYRGISSYYKHKEIFESQIKALILANEYSNIKIMFPMIENKEQFLRLKHWVLDIKKSMNDVRPIQIGMMLETKHALNNIIDFIDADFISIGTNDLTKELYNITRNEKSKNLEFIKDLLNQLAPVVNFCDKYDKCLSVCGELASIKEVSKEFMKIGIKNYSVSSPNIKSLFLAIGEVIENA